MHTSPTSLLDAHCNIPPFIILLHNAIRQAAIRLASIPTTHPLHNRIMKASNKPAKKFPSLIDIIFRLNPINTKKIESIPIIRKPPWWRPQINTKIEDREMATNIPQALPGELQVHTDGSVINGGVGSAAIAFWKDQRWRDLTCRVT